LETAQRSTRRVLTLTVNLLDLGSIQAGTFSVNPRAIPYLEVVSEAIATSEPVLIGKGQQAQIKMEAPPGIRVLADPVRITQVLVHLIANASKYGPAK